MTSSEHLYKLWLEEEKIRLLIEQMETKTNKEKRMDKYVENSPEKFKITEDPTLHIIEAEQALFLENYQMNIKRKNKNKVIPMKKQKDIDLIKQYDAEEGLEPAHTKLIIPDLNMYNDKIELKNEENYRLQQELNLINTQLEDLNAAIMTEAGAPEEKREDETEEEREEKIREREKIRMMIKGENESERDVLIHKGNSIASNINTNDQIIREIEAERENVFNTYTKAQADYMGPAFDINPLPYESKEEYLKRLSDNEELQMSVETKLFKIKNRIIQKFRENINDILKNPSLTETISNTIEDALGNSSDDVDGRKKINDDIVNFKKAYKEAYGARKNISTSEFCEFSREFLEKPKLVKGFVERLEDAENKMKPVIGGQKGTGTMYKIEDSGHIAYFGWKGQAVFWTIEEEGPIGSWIEYKSKYLDIFQAKTHINITKIHELFGTETALGIKKYLVSEGISPLSLKIKNIKEPQVDKYGDPTGEEIVLKGMGLKRPFANSPETVEFGYLTIFLRRLKSTNILKVKRGKWDLSEYPRKRVSDKFIILLEHTLKNGAVDKDELENLDEDEKNLFIHLVETAGLSNILRIKRKPDEMLGELNILVGEVEAGNNNPSIINKIKHILQQLYRDGHITSTERVAYLKEVTK